MFCYNIPMTAFRWPIHVYLSKLDQWEFETLLEALSVEYSFLHMVKMLKQLHQMRMERLLCEENSSFLQLLKDVDDKVQTVIDFVINAEHLIASTLTDPDDLLAVRRRKLADDFISAGQWAFDQIKSRKVRQNVKALVKKHEFHQSFLMLGETGDSFADHSIAVVNALLIMAQPSHEIEVEKDYAAIFKKTLDTFLATRLWKRKSQEWKMVVESKCEEYVLRGHGSRIDYLRALYDHLDHCEEMLLSEFGILHMNIHRPECKAALSRQIYDSLNGLQSGEQGVKKMTEDDLRVFLAYVAQKQYIGHLIDQLCLPHGPETASTQQAPAKAKAATKRQARSEKQFLADGIDKALLPRILQEASLKHLDGAHRKQEVTMMWQDYHLVICLFYYLLDSKNGDTGLYSGLGSAFYRTFNKADFPTLCSYRHFHDTQVELELHHFSKIIHADHADDFEDKKLGHASLKSWYLMYKRLLPIFEKHLPRRS